jgi:predicted nucleic acid-binding protein
MVLIGDERPGRAAATSLGVLVTGSMGVLYKAVETGALTVDEADTAISRMRSARQWLPVQRYQDVKAFVDANPLRADWLKNL